MTNIIANGNVLITVNTQETEAKLVFTPDPKGLGWDVDAVNKLIGENNLSPPLSPKVLEPFLQKAAKAKTPDPMEMVICQGTPLEESVPETVAWEALPVPDEMASFQEETLSTAGPPRLFRVKVEKIKIEKKVKKPGALPFMPAKEETVVSWDKKETRQAAAVDTGICEIKYAGQGKKLGTMTPQKPGKPGKSVYGRPLQPKVLPEGGFLLGDGIARDKGDLVAQVSGFVRIGENWADIVPLAKPSWEIYTGSDGVTLFFRFNPGDKRFEAPEGEKILSAAKDNGAVEGSLISAEVLDKAIKDSIKSGVPVEAFSLFESKEAAALVEINSEKTQALLHLRKGTAGHLPLEMKAISQAVKDSGVRGFDAEKLRAAIQAFMSGKDVELRGYVLAEGVPSTRGKDKEIRLSVDLLSEEEYKPILARLKAGWDRFRQEEGLAPEEATGFAFVEKGTAIAQVITSSEGEEGKDVFGNVISGLPGNDPDLKLFRGLEQHGTHITAARSGLLLIKAEERKFRADLAEYQDAKVTVSISEDAMEARGDLVREVGAGVPLSVENLLKTLSALGVKKGIDQEAIKKACVLAWTKGSCKGIVMARGKPPVARGGVSIKWLVPVSPPQLEGEDGNGAGPGHTVQVKAGTVIAQLSGEEADGRPGFDIKGNEISADQGFAFNLEHDDAIQEIAFEKGKRLAAVRPGELSFDGKKLVISSIKEIEGDVGPATGNINFSGEVRISGKVSPGFVIIGGLHVLIGGAAEAALISAGGKAVIAQGIKGGGKGVVRARATIEAAFSEKATLMAVDDIKLKNGSIASRIKTNGRLSITADNGKLLGGVCQARRGIDAADIGSEKVVRTEISFGQDYLIKDQIAAAEEEIFKVKGEIAKIDMQIKAVLKVPSAMETARNEKIKRMKQLEQLNLKVFTLREKFEEHHDSEIRIRGTIHPGVVIESHDRYYEVRQTRSRVVFYFDRESGCIKERNLG
ncbi:MAG: FapA family protein [Treponema sp.]|jgi:uncharacterized protein (DUF342 family)|nr:FapA family protein [Treponema sp.]